MSWSTLGYEINTPNFISLVHHYSNDVHFLGRYRFLVAQMCHEARVGRKKIARKQNQATKTHTLAATM